MDLTWLILGNEFVLMVVIWIAVLTFAPLEYANNFWLGGALWMIAALGAAATAHGPTSDTTMLVSIQTLVYCLLSAIIFARDYTDPDSDLGAADRITDVAAYLGGLTRNNESRHGRPPENEQEPQQPAQQQQRRRRPRHVPPWERHAQNGQTQQRQQQQRRQHRGTDTADDTEPSLDDLVDDIDEFRE